MHPEIDTFKPPLLSMYSDLLSARFNLDAGRYEIVDHSTLHTLSPEDVLGEPFAQYNVDGLPEMVVFPLRKGGCVARLTPIIS